MAPVSARKVPAGQAWQSSTLSCSHVVAPSSTRKVPAGQMVHVEAPGDEYEPAGHITQSSLLSCEEMVAPSSARKVPAGQAWQSSTPSWASAELPSSVRNEPAGHGLHVAAPEDEYEPAGQMVHVPAPGDEYSPAGHTWQFPSPSLKVPDWHELQSSGLSWEVMAPSSSIFKPAGQVEHVTEAEFEVYESAAHTEHGPASAEKVPAAQRPQETHDPPPSTSALVLVPSEPGPHEQSRVPPRL